MPIYAHLSSRLLVHLYTVASPVVYASTSMELVATPRSPPSIYLYLLYPSAHRRHPHTTSLPSHSVAPLPYSPLFI